MYGPPSHHQPTSMSPALYPLPSHSQIVSPFSSMRPPFSFPSSTDSFPQSLHTRQRSQPAESHMSWGEGGSSQYHQGMGGSSFPSSVSRPSPLHFSHSSSTSASQSHSQSSVLTPSSPRSSSSSSYSQGSSSTTSSAHSLHSPSTPHHDLPLSHHSRSQSSHASTSVPVQSSPPSSITSIMPSMPYTRIDPATDHHFIVTPGDLLIDRYEVVKLVGRGTFSQVVQCRDLIAEQRMQAEDSSSSSSSSSPPPRRQVMVAIKVVRAVDRYRYAAEREARLLQHLNQRQAALLPSSPFVYGAEGCVPYLGSFPLDAHICLVFPVLGLSLYDFLRLHRFRPLFPAHIRHIAHQLLLTSYYLHAHCNVIHADIKPESQHTHLTLSTHDNPFLPYPDNSLTSSSNSPLCVVDILLVDSTYQTIHVHEMGPINVPLSTNVRLIDFGTAVHAGAEKPSIVVSRSYRAIEIVLGVGWGNGVDVWAIGCVLMELYTGHRLFNIGSGSDEDHLKQMEALLGNIPISLLTQPRVYPLGNGGTATSSTPSSPGWSAGGSVGSSGGGVGGSGVGAVGGVGGPTGRLRDRIVASDVHFCDLIERMLTFDPTHRITARQALQHPYFIDTD